MKEPNNTFVEIVKIIEEKVRGSAYRRINEELIDVPAHWPVFFISEKSKEAKSRLL